MSERGGGGARRGDPRRGEERRRPRLEGSHVREGRGRAWGLQVEGKSRGGKGARMGAASGGEESGREGGAHGGCEWREERSR